jgi:hypothetical protein
MPRPPASYRELMLPYKSDPSETYELNVQRMLVDLTEHCYSFYPELLGRADDPARNFSPVGPEEFRYNYNNVENTTTEADRLATRILSK